MTKTPIPPRALYSRVAKKFADKPAALTHKTGVNEYTDKPIDPILEPAAAAMLNVLVEASGLQLEKAADRHSPGYMAKYMRAYRKKAK